MRASPGDSFTHGSKTMRNQRRSTIAARRGAAAIELAVLLPFLIFLAVIATDWARMMYYTITLENCARSGALYACDSDTRSKSPYTTVSDAALAEAPNLSSDSQVSNLSVVQTDLADGGDGQKAVVVTVSMTFNSFTNFKYGTRFGLSSSETISRSVQMRVEPLTPN